MPRKNNVQKINYLLTGHLAGPLTPVFILEAITRYAHEVQAAGEPADNSRAWINPQAWHATAKMITASLQFMEGEPDHELAGLPIYDTTPYAEQ